MLLELLSADDLTVFSEMQVRGASAALRLCSCLPQDFDPLAEEQTGYGCMQAGVSIHSGMVR
jgi:hypothetical protein